MKKTNETEPPYVGCYGFLNQPCAVVDSVLKNAVNQPTQAQTANAPEKKGKPTMKSPMAHQPEPLVRPGLCFLLTACLLRSLFHSGPAFADGCPVSSFAAAPALRAGPSPRFVAVGDFNGDGKADLALANFDSPGNVSWKSR